MIRISEKLRLQVAQNANFKCEYCLIPEYFLATTFHIDHIRSIKHRGESLPINLAYACPHCNQNKGSDIASYNDQEEITRFFNPRSDNWEEHFEVNPNGIIAHLTAIGEVTIRTLF
jgi:5-methylcytosine-specific restriction endonuclease McrA